MNSTKLRKRAPPFVPGSKSIGRFDLALDELFSLAFINIAVFEYLNSIDGIVIAFGFIGFMVWDVDVRDGQNAEANPDVMQSTAAIYLVELKNMRTCFNFNKWTDNRSSVFGFLPSLRTGERRYVLSSIFSLRLCANGERGGKNKSAYPVAK